MTGNNNKFKAPAFDESRALFNASEDLLANMYGLYDIALVSANIFIGAANAHLVSCNLSCDINFHTTRRGNYTHYNNSFILTIRKMIGVANSIMDHVVESILSADSTIRSDFSCFINAALSVAAYNGACFCRVEGMGPANYSHAFPARSEGAENAVSKSVLDVAATLCEFRVADVCAPDERVEGVRAQQDRLTTVVPGRHNYKPMMVPKAAGRVVNSVKAPLRDYGEHTSAARDNCVCKTKSCERYRVDQFKPNITARDAELGLENSLRLSALITSVEMLDECDGMPIFLAKEGPTPETYKQRLARQRGEMTNQR